MLKLNIKNILIPDDITKKEKRISRKKYLYQQILKVLKWVKW